ncbi:hypothetical protein C660_02285 [Alcaligenes sp. HPC1271]|nr:hypothetical protein C660_02285 [Alcaligenes sp. HPC1271]
MLWANKTGRYLIRLIRTGASRVGNEGGGGRDTKGAVLLIVMRIGIRLAILADQTNPERIGSIASRTEGNGKAIVLF